MKNTKGWKIFKIFLKILIIIAIVLAVAIVALAGTFFFVRWHKDVQEKDSGERNIIEQLVTSNTKKEEPVVTCLFLGVNGNLTDFIMLGQYDPNTREIDLLSIPRDTNVGNGSVDGKINSTYASRGLDTLKQHVEDITGIEPNYYIKFDTKILRKIVDAIGGVTVDVPINMNYDDPEQNLYIHLKKGTQTLTGSQAEQFVRFRKNNDGSGYAGGDVERTKTQQKFIKAFIAELLQADNISKIPNLINIVLEGTKTDITLDIAKEYIDDVIALRTDRINTNTAPGEGRYAQSPLGYKTSYYFIDETATKTMVDEMFHNTKSESGDAQEVISSSVSVIDQSGEQTIRVELLNAGTTSKAINELVDKLKAKNFYVVKIGNYETTSKEASRIIDYGLESEELLNSLKETIGVTKVETKEDSDSTVAFTIIVGPYYK